MQGEGPGFGRESGSEPVSGKIAMVLSSPWISRIGRHRLIVCSISLSGLETMSWGWLVAWYGLEVDPTIAVQLLTIELGSVLGCETLNDMISRS